jgi:hypothetical protein
MSALCLLDLTAAFNTVDHDLLLLRLERQFGLCGNVLEWLRSYLSGRTFRVVYGGCTSSIVYIMCSVPQGSVLGPLLFILYMTDLTDMVARHGVNLNVYADDTQLYLHCRRDDTASPDSNTASQTLATGCTPTDSSSTWTRQSCSWLARDIATPCWVAFNQLYSWEPTLLQPATMLDG